MGVNHGAAGYYSGIRKGGADGDRGTVDGQDPLGGQGFQPEHQLGVAVVGVGDRQNG